MTLARPGLPKDVDGPAPRRPSPGHCPCPRRWPRRLPVAGGTLHGGGLDAGGDEDRKRVPTRSWPPRSSPSGIAGDGALPVRRRQRRRARGRSGCGAGRSPATPGSPAPAIASAGFNSPRGRLRRRAGLRGRHGQRDRARSLDGGAVTSAASRVVAFTDGVGRRRRSTTPKVLPTAARSSSSTPATTRSGIDPATGAVSTVAGRLGGLARRDGRPRLLQHPDRRPSAPARLSLPDRQENVLRRIH